MNGENAMATTLVVPVKEEVWNAYKEHLDGKIGDLTGSRTDIKLAMDDAPKSRQAYPNDVMARQFPVAIEIDGRLESLKNTRDLIDSIPRRQFDRVDVGAFIIIEKDEIHEYFLVVPGEGGEVFYCGDLEICTVSTDAPIILHIWKAKKGDIFQLGIIKNII